MEGRSRVRLPLLLPRPPSAQGCAVLEGAQLLGAPQCTQPVMGGTRAHPKAFVMPSTDECHHRDLAPHHSAMQQPAATRLASLGLRKAPSTQGSEEAWHCGAHRLRCRASSACSSQQRWRAPSAAASRPAARARSTSNSPPPAAPPDPPSCPLRDRTFELHGLLVPATSASCKQGNLEAWPYLHAAAFHKYGTQQHVAMVWVTWC